MSSSWNSTLTTTRPSPDGPTDGYEASVFGHTKTPGLLGTPWVSPVDTDGTEEPTTGHTVSGCRSH